jgi:3-methyladenine DNA glycosylase AlkD
MGAELVTAVRAALRAVRDPGRAPAMQTYMKSAMPYLGVPVPEVRRITRRCAAASPLESAADLQVSVRALWYEAAFREERYAATALCDVPAARGLRSPELLPLYRELIVSGAWWDHTDELAHRVGELLAGWPDQVRPEVRGWIAAGDLWLRRVAIICQLGRRADTDLSLLVDAISANAADREFFIRKAIGWALRDYARTDPGWVVAFVAANELSPLSRREALKHIGYP